MIFTIIVKESTEGSPLFCFRGKLRQNFPGGAADFSPAVRQAAKPPIGRRGLRGAEVVPAWLRGASLPQRKAPQGVKKARRGLRGAEVLPAWLRGGKPAEEKSTARG